LLDHDSGACSKLLIGKDRDIRSMPTKGSPEGSVTEREFVLLEGQPDLRVAVGSCWSPISVGAPFRPIS
jgi:hypothetical protein